MKTLGFVVASGVLGWGLTACSSPVFTTADDGGSGSTSSGSAASSGTSSGSTSGSCVSNGDCPNNGVCGYPQTAACAATGECFASPGAICNAFSPGCACDGSEINVACTGLPSGYFSKPLRHTGECTSVSDAGASGDGGACFVSASNYDQSCTIDSDCQMVSSGNYCTAMCSCGGSAINAAAGAQFNDDVSKTPLGSGALGFVDCNCPLEIPPCCLHGVCEVDACSVPADK
jgi:hypothetical protein